MVRYFWIMIGLVCCLGIFPVQAKNDGDHSGKDVPEKAKKWLQKSNELSLYEDYEGAKKLLQKVIKKYPDYIPAYQKLGALQVKLKEYEAAKSSYQQILSIDNSPKKQFMVYFLVGEIEQAQENYTAAITAFKNCLDAFPQKEKINNTRIRRSVKRAEMLLAQVQFAEHAIAHPVEFEPIRLASSINSKHDEYLPMLTADEGTIVFTRRFNYAIDPAEDFYKSHSQLQADTLSWQAAIGMEQPINTKGNEGAICISPDGQRLFFAAKDRKDGLGNFDLYYCVKSGEGWTGPYNLGAPINSPSWESQPSISADGKSLYFCSRRGGGLGGIDIWVTHLEDNYWTKPKNLGQNINTGKDEQCPFIHPDNQTFYFSSNGRIGMGGADLYVSRKQADGTWGKAENLGYPINTKGVESSLIVNARGDKAYFSAHNDSTGFDLHYFELPEPVRPHYVTYVKGKVFDEETTFPLEANIELTDLATGELVLETKTNSKNGEFLVPLPAGKNYMYNVAKKDYLFYSEHFSLAQTKDINAQKPYLIDIPLSPLQLDMVAETEVKEKLPVIEEVSKIPPIPAPQPPPTKTVIPSSPPSKAPTKVRTTAKKEVVVTPPLKKETSIKGLTDAVEIELEDPIEPTPTKPTPPELTLPKPIPTVRPKTDILPTKQWNVGKSVVLKNVFFETNAYALQAISYLELNRLIELLKENPSLTIEIGGHTDNVGQEAYNLDLSTKRAESVYNYLVNNGINAAQLTYKGYGESTPIADNETEEGRALNRRTEFTILKR